jgi:hypothetical protein
MPEKCLATDDELRGDESVRCHSVLCGFDTVRITSALLARQRGAPGDFNERGVCYLQGLVDPMTSWIHACTAFTSEGLHSRSDRLGYALS